MVETVVGSCRRKKMVGWSSEVVQFVGAGQMFAGMVQAHPAKRGWHRSLNPSELVPLSSLLQALDSLNLQLSAMGNKCSRGSKRNKWNCHNGKNSTFHCSHSRVLFGQTSLYANSWGLNTVCHDEEAVNDLRPTIRRYQGKKAAESKKRCVEPLSRNRQPARTQTRYETVRGEIADHPSRTRSSDRYMPGLNQDGVFYTRPYLSVLQKVVEEALLVSSYDWEA